MSESIEEKMVSVNQKELSLLVTNIIPTSKYFELRFDNMQELGVLGGIVGIGVGPSYHTVCSSFISKK